MRIRDQGGGVSPANLPHIFSYAFTTAGRMGSTHDNIDENGGGPYAAQTVGGSAGIGGNGRTDDGNMFGENHRQRTTDRNGHSTRDLVMGRCPRWFQVTTLTIGVVYPLPSCTPTYFGGDLQLVSLYNHGTDVFLR